MRKQSGFAAALVLLGAAALPAQQLISTLDGLLLGERTIAFGDTMTLLAFEHADERPRVFPSRLELHWLRVAAIDGTSLAAELDVWVRVDRARLAAHALSEGDALWLEGELLDVGDCLGSTRLSYDDTSVMSATEEQHRLRLAAAPEPDLAESIGETVTITARLLSMNGEWWLQRSGESLLLADAGGRRRTFPTDWHFELVLARGRVERQLRLPLHRGSTSVRDEPLQQFFVLFDSEVARCTEPIDRANHLVNYAPTVAPRRVDGVYDLIPQGLPRNWMGNESRARLFAERNQPWLRALLADDRQATRDVLATRMQDEARERGMRLLYAGVLAAHDDVRGRDFLAASLSDPEASDPSALYVLGAFAKWRDGQRCDESWAEGLALRCMREQPAEVASRSDLVELPLRLGSHEAAEMLVTQLEAGAFGPRDFPSDPAGDVRRALARAEAVLTDEQLLRVARTDPGENHSRRTFAGILLRRDVLAAVDEFLPELTESSWFDVFRENAGWRVLAEIASRQPKLEPELRAKVDDLLLLRAPEAGERLLLAIGDPATPVERLPELCWYLTQIPQGERFFAAAAAPVATALRTRVLGGSESASRNAFGIDSLLRFIARSSQRDAVAAMIELLDADFSGVVGEQHREHCMHNLVAGLLAEMTGQSFGPDAAAWRGWFEAGR